MFRKTNKRKNSFAPHVWYLIDSYYNQKKSLKSNYISRLYFPENFQKNALPGKWGSGGIENTFKRGTGTNTAQPFSPNLLQQHGPPVYTPFLIFKPIFVPFLLSIGKSEWEWAYLPQPRNFYDRRAIVSRENLRSRHYFLGKLYI